MRVKWSRRVKTDGEELGAILKFFCRFLASWESVGVIRRVDGIERRLKGSFREFRCG